MRGISGTFAQKKKTIQINQNKSVGMGEVFDFKFNCLLIFI